MCYQALLAYIGGHYPSCPRVGLPCTKSWIYWLTLINPYWWPLIYNKDLYIYIYMHYKDPRCAVDDHKPWTMFWPQHNSTMQKKCLVTLFDWDLGYLFSSEICCFNQTNSRSNVFIEGSLEVKLPTIWTDEKQSRAEAERRGRLEERRSEEKE